MSFTRNKNINAKILFLPTFCTRMKVLGLYAQNRLVHTLWIISTHNFHLKWTQNLAKVWATQMETFFDIFLRNQTGFVKTFPYFHLFVVAHHNISTAHLTFIFYFWSCVPPLHLPTHWITWVGCPSIFTLPTHFYTYAFLPLFSCSFLM